MSRPAAALAPDRVRVLVVTDEPLLRIGLLHALRSHPWVQVVGWGQRPDALPGLVADCGAHVVLAAVADGVEWARLADALAGVPLLVLTDDESAPRTADASVGRLSRRAGVDEIAAAVVAVRAGLAVGTSAGPAPGGMPAPEVVDLVEPAGTVAAVLTPREREIVQLLVDGMSVKQVASRLGIAMQTAKNHIHHVMGKVGTSTRLQLYAWAKENGFTETASLVPPAARPRREA
jgi:DNA-binding NarL/FixJ family response regulator